jgi:dethiobiotin synthetase
LRGLFVTGTDTGAGKSVVAAAICAALVAEGERVSAFKPVVTGLDEEPGEWPMDHELLAGATGQPAADVAPYTFGPAVSPHWAADQAGRPIEPERLVSAARAAPGFVVCEGVGGLLVPLTTGYSVRDLAVDLGLPMVVAARTGLGTINHTLLTVEAARAAGLTVAGIVMTPWPERPEPIEASNRRTVEQLSGVPVSGLPRTAPGALAAAGAALPLGKWRVTPNA